MKQLKKTLLLPLITILALLPQTLTAKEVAGIDVADTITLADTELQLNGAGTRSKFFMDLYVGALYLPQKAQSTADVLSQEQVAIRLTITSSMISTEKMTDGINSGFDSATSGNTAPIQPQIAQFLALFSEEIVEGDQFTFAISKTTGVTSYKNGQLQTTIEGEDFRIALLNIWLGEDPAQASLKEEMLGL